MGSYGNCIDKTIIPERAKAINATLVAIFEFVSWRIRDNTLISKSKHHGNQYQLEKIKMSKAFLRMFKAISCLFVLEQTEHRTSGEGGPMDHASPTSLKILMKKKAKSSFAVSIIREIY